MVTIKMKWFKMPSKCTVLFCQKQHHFNTPCWNFSPHLFFSYVICSSIKSSIDIPKMLHLSVLKESWWDWLASCSDIFSLFFHFWNPPSFVNLLILLFSFPNSKNQKQYNDLSFGLSKRLGIRLFLSFPTCLVKKHLVNLRLLRILADSTLSWFWSSSGPFTMRFF